MGVTAFVHGEYNSTNDIGGFGVVLLGIDRDGIKHIKYISQAARSTTSNRMELVSVCSALDALKIPASITIFIDSDYVINGWKDMKSGTGIPTDNQDLWEKLQHAAKPHELKISLIPASIAHISNYKAIELSESAIADMIEEGK